MAGCSTTVNLNYSMLDDIPEEIIDDKNYQENLSQLYLKLNLIENLVRVIFIILLIIINSLVM